MNAAGTTSSCAPPSDGEPPVQLREAQVVADRQADPQPLDVGHHGLGPGRDRARTPGRRPDRGSPRRTGGSCDSSRPARRSGRRPARCSRCGPGPGRPRGTSRRAPRSRAAGGAGEEAGELAVDRLRLRAPRRRPEVVDVLGEHGEVRAAGGGALQQGLARPQVASRSSRALSWQTATRMTKGYGWRARSRTASPSGRHGGGGDGPTAPNTITPAAQYRTAGVTRKGSGGLLLAVAPSRGGR